MAEKMVFFSENNHSRMYNEEIIEYEYFSGFTLSQKQKCIKSLHEKIKYKYPKKKVIEISTKSPDSLGVQLSAFNLKYRNEKNNYWIENIFQSSKVFEKGGPYLDLLKVNPRDAKRDDRLRNSGSLILFRLDNQDWDLEPKTMFYDWIYINALNQHPELIKQICEYDVFTDIEFNHKKSLNCQARSVAIFVNLYKKGILNNYLKNKNEFKKVYNVDKEILSYKQLNLLDF